MLPKTRSYPNHNLSCHIQSSKSPLQSSLPKSVTLDDVAGIGAGIPKSASSCKSATNRPLVTGPPPGWWKKRVAPPSRLEKLLAGQN